LASGGVHGVPGIYYWYRVITYCVGLLLKQYGMESNAQQNAIGLPLSLQCYYNTIIYYGRIQNCIS